MATEWERWKYKSFLKLNEGEKCQREHVVDHSLDSINAAEWFGTAFEESDTHTKEWFVKKATTTGAAELRKWWRFGELCLKHVGLNISGENFL